MAAARRLGRLWWPLFAACQAATAPVAEVAPAPPPAAAAASRGPALPVPDLEMLARARALGREIRCPVCQGMPIGESPATMAQDMQARVNQMVAQGADDDEVRRFFTDRYGEWVLLDPPRRGVTLWLWVLPWAFVSLAAGAVVGVWRRAGRRPPAAAAAPPPVEANLLEQIRRASEP